MDSLREVAENVRDEVEVMACCDLDSFITNDPLFESFFDALPVESAAIDLDTESHSSGLGTTSVGHEHGSHNAGMTP